MSASLIWHLIRDNNSFLVKRGRTDRDGSVQFSTEAGNVLGVNTFKYSGLANDRTINIGTDLTLSTQNDKLLNKPSSNKNTVKLGLHTGKALKKIAELGAYRADLNSAAQHRYKKIARSTGRKAHGFNKVVKSARRGK